MFLRQISKLCLTKPPGSIDIGSQIPRSRIWLNLVAQQICGGSDPCGSRQMDRQGSSAWPAACGNRTGAEKTGIVILLSPPLFYTRFSRYSFWSFRLCPDLSGLFGFFPDRSSLSGFFPVLPGSFPVLSRSFRSFRVLPGSFMFCPGLSVFPSLSGYFRFSRFSGFSFFRFLFRCLHFCDVGIRSLIPV